MTTDKEHQFMPHKLNVPAATGDKQTEVTLDVKTARRMLAWVNAANRPEDLMTPPEILTHFHMEYRKRSYPEKHPPVHETHEKKEGKMAQTKRMKKRKANMARTKRAN
jgi:hypothetical protein